MKNIHLVAQLNRSIFWNGLIEQWGRSDSNIRNTTINFPITFTNNPCIAFSYYRGGSCEYTLNSVTTATFYITSNENGNGGSWIAIGY